MNQKEKITAFIILSFGLISISVASILIKLCSAPPMIISVYRLTIAAAFYSMMTKLQRKTLWKNLSPKQRRLAISSGLFLSMHFITWITSLRYTSVASSVVIVQTAPIFVALGSYLLIHEKPSLMSGIGVVLALIGSIIIALHDFSGTLYSLKGTSLALIGAIAAAGYFIIGRRLRPHLSTLQYVSVVYSVAAVTTLLLTFSTQDPFFSYSWKTFSLLIAIAFFPQIIGHTSLNWALKYFSATAVSIIALAEPVGASLLAIIVLKEFISFSKALGGLVVLCGVIMTLMGEKDKTSNRATPRASLTHNG